MKKGLLWAIAGAIVVGLGVMAGLIPLTASSGHWRVTSFVLDLAKRRSVDTHSFFISPPPLTDRALIARGAAHYESGCATCHGSPAAPRPTIVMGMTPHPPFLPDRIRRWLPRELFYIVKHGIKFTGMPAWPSRHRDDEVWSMVAFLRELPSMDAKRYADLTGRAVAQDDRLPMEDILGPAADVRPAVTQNCARCHGVDGRGRGPGALPKLAGQRWEYIAGSLEAYARGERHSGIMEPVAANLGTDEMQAIARYYAGLPGADDAPSTLDARLIQQGREIAERGAPERLIPACTECHGPGTERNPNYPRLAGQHADYIARQLELFKGDRRGGTAYRTIMLKIAGQLTEEQVQAVAAYYASLREP